MLDPHRPARAAFTLIELLVVIAVIALLIGILLPSLAGARESARTQVCASNLRQLSIASVTYAHDHKGQYSTGAFDSRSNRGLGPLDQQGWIANFLNGGYCIPGQVLCPSSPARVSQNLAPTRRTGINDQQALQLLKDGFNSNYAQSWFMAHTEMKRVAQTSADPKDPANTVGPLRDDRIGSGVPAERVPIFGDGTVDMDENDDIFTLAGTQYFGAKAITDGPGTDFIPGRGAVRGRQLYEDFGPVHGKGRFVEAVKHDRLYGNLGFADGHVAQFADAKPRDGTFEGVPAAIAGVQTRRYDDFAEKVFGGWLLSSGLP